MVVEAFEAFETRGDRGMMLGDEGLIVQSEKMCFVVM